MAYMKKGASCVKIFLLSCFFCGPPCAHGARPWSISLDSFRPWGKCETSICAPVAGCTFAGDYDGAPLARTGTCPTSTCPDSYCDKLALYNLNITSVPAGSFESMSTVKSLILRGNTIMSLSAVVFPSSLVTLDLSENKLESLRGVVWPGSLKTLDLGSNNIVSLDGVVFPSGLTRLRLSYNHIHFLPPAFFSNLTSLKELDIRSIGGNISCVPVTSEQLQQLTTYLGPSQCITECDVGYEAPPGDVCRACAAGYFKNVSGSHNCTVCPVQHESSPDKTSCQFQIPSSNSDNGGIGGGGGLFVGLISIGSICLVLIFFHYLNDVILPNRRRRIVITDASRLGKQGLGDALCEASQSGDTALVRGLLKVGADVNHEREGRSAIALADNNKVSEELVRHMVQKPWRKDSIVQKLWRDADSVVVLDHVGVGKGMQEDYTFEFGGSAGFFGWFRTFSTFQADVKLSGDRFYYEVEIKHLQGGARFGWAQILDEGAAETKGWKSSAGCSYDGVGDNPFSWTVKCEWNNDTSTIFGQNLKKGDVLGVGCDMINKTTSFSLNGSFGAPFGVVLEPITAEWIAPAFTASKGSQVVANFGAPQKFKHAPPDGYVSVHEAAKSRQSQRDSAHLNQPDCVVTVSNDSDDAVRTLTTDNADGVTTDTRNTLGAALCAVSKLGHQMSLCMLMNAGADVIYTDTDGKTQNAIALAADAHTLRIFSPLWAPTKEGKLEVKTSAGDKELEFTWAGLGSRPSSIIDVAAVLCDPEHAEKELSNAEQLAGKVAVVKRSDRTTFAEQAQRAEKADSLALVVINSDNTRFEIKPESSPYRLVTIPVLMVAADAADTLLVQSGAQVCLKGDTAHVAGTTCHENIVGGGLLAVSRIGDDFDLMRTFLNMRADVNYRDANGKTPLMIASECGHLDIVKKLLDKDADVNCKDANDKTPLIIASERGHLVIVKKLLEKGADVNCKDVNGKTAIDLAASRINGSLRAPIRDILRENREINIVGDQYGAIVEAAKQSLEEAPQSKRMVGDLKDLRAGEFADTANGLKQFLKVQEDWAPAKECAELEEEVHRLRDCPQCAKVQADVLKEMASEGNALLLKTSEITACLAGDLVALQSARRTGNDKEEETRLENKVKQTRKEIDDIGGWYYGCDDAPAVAWPESKVNHAWGTYGQPMCDGCKKYALDHSTISADFNSCLHEVSSEKVCFNGVRDKGRAGKTIDYFVELPEAKDTGMNKPEAASLRFYSSHSFGAVTNPLRDPTRETEHPLAAITYCIDQAIRKQLKWGAKDKNAASKEVVLWRGFSDLQLSDEFKVFGGTEFAPMSTTTDVRVAVGYAIRKTTTGGALLMRIVTKNNLERGMDLQWISMFPGESERLLAPLTFMNKPKRFQEIEINGVNDQKVKLTVVEIEITAPPM